jgi:protein-disulfide isomerase
MRSEVNMRRLISDRAQLPALQNQALRASTRQGRQHGTFFRFLTLIAGLGLASPAFATHAPKAVGDFDEKAAGDVEEIIRNYIANHPEELVKALQKLQLQQQRAQEENLRKSAGGVKPVTADDHVLGKPDAPVKVIEFSDFECPFCKGFHGTLKQMMDEYGSTGQVAWVYRHFPLDDLHSKARKEAQAAECANELGGNQAFWAYAETLFEVTPSNDRLDLTVLPDIAEKVGLDRAKFEACLAGDENGGKFADHIEADYQDATAAGGTGTPFTIILGADGEAFPLTGAQPYGAIKSIIDLALKP